METFKLPMRAIRKTYTKSELAILAWRSAETAYNMDLQMAQAQRSSSDEHGPRDLLELEQRLRPFEHRLTNETGEVDLRKLTTQEAMQFFDALGVGNRN